MTTVEGRDPAVEATALGRPCEVRSRTRHHPRGAGRRFKSSAPRADPLSMAATLAAHVDRWAHEIVTSGAPVEVPPPHGASLASACRGALAADLPSALVAVARRLPEGDLASLEARLARSIARASV